MTRTHPDGSYVSPGFIYKVALALATLGAVAWIGWEAKDILNSKANASDIVDIRTQITQWRDDDTKRYLNVNTQLNAVLRRNNIQVLIPYPEVESIKPTR